MPPRKPGQRRPSPVARIAALERELAELKQRHVREVAELQQQIADIEARLPPKTITVAETTPMKPSAYLQELGELWQRAHTPRSTGGRHGRDREAIFDLMRMKLIAHLRECGIPVRKAEDANLLTLTREWIHEFFPRPLKLPNAVTLKQHVIRPAIRAVAAEQQKTSFAKK